MWGGALLYMRAFGLLHREQVKYFIPLPMLIVSPQLVLRSVYAVGPLDSVVKTHDYTVSLPVPSLSSQFHSAMLTSIRRDLLMYVPYIIAAYIKIYYTFYTYRAFCAFYNMTSPYPSLGICLSPAVHCDCLVRTASPTDDLLLELE